MASRSIDSSGLSSRRLTVQHSGGRSLGWIEPGTPVLDDLFDHPPELLGVARPARPQEKLHRLGRADQPTVLVELGKEERHKVVQVLDVMPQRRKLHGAREEPQEPGQIAARRVPCPR